MNEEQQAKVIAETVTQQFNDHFPDDRNMVHEPLPEVHAPELVERDHAMPANHTDWYVQSSTEKDIACLEFIRERLVYIYGESNSYKHIIKLSQIIDNLRSQ